MQSIELATVDWAVLVSYLVVALAIGFIAGRKVKSSEHYFMGSRKFSRWVMIGQSFGTGTHAEMPVSLAGAVYQIGLSGIWYQWKNMFATPFYWLIAPLFRRARRTTIAEMVEDRYGPWMAVFYTFFALSFFTIGTASMLKGAGKVISQAVGGKIPANEIVIAMTLVFIVYSFFGGLLATAWNDIIQGFLIIALSFMLIPLGWEAFGGMAGMRAALDPHKLSLAAPQGIGPWFILMLTINGLVGIMAQPHVMAMVGTGKDEKSCREGFLYGTFVKRVCTIGWAFVGLMVAALVAQGRFGTLHDPEDAFGFACRNLLFAGGVGLLVASVLAANMAACSAFMVDSGALFVRSLYARHFAPGRSDRHYLWVGRVGGLAITMIAVVYAVFFIKRVLYSFLLTETMATYVGITILGGVFWRRGNRWGAVAGIVVAFATNFTLYAVRGERLDHWSPDVFLAALLAGSAAYVIVSLLTPPEPAPAMLEFYSKMDTPADVATGHSPAEEGKQLLLVNLFHLRRGAAGQPLFRAYRSDLVGFAQGWAIAIGLVVLTWLIVNIGRWL
jgi:Na+/proline symporter